MAQLGKMRMPENPFLGGYILDRTPERAGLIKKLLEKLTMDESRIITDAWYLGPLGREEIESQNSAIWDMPILTDAVVEDWLAVIRYCDFFVTDSFHGICFAVIFRKPFVVVLDKQSWRGFSRIKSFLKMLGLEDRHVESWEQIEEKNLLHHAIDYEQVHKILGTEIEKSSAWLKNALEEGEKKQGNKDTYDILCDRMAYQTRLFEDHLNKIKQEMEEMQQKIRCSLPYRIYRKLRKLKNLIWTLVGKHHPV
jgi:hypothetical protein